MFPNHNTQRAGINPRFRKSLIIKSIEQFPGKASLEFAGRLLLPQSMLLALVEGDSPSPYIFRLTVPRTASYLHFGVNDFIAEEGVVYAPSWALRQLNLTPGSEVILDVAELPRGSYAKLKAMSMDFITDNIDERALLEGVLADFCALTKNQILPIMGPKNKIYEFKVIETAPTNAVCIIHTDLSIDFDEPVGYDKWRREQERKKEYERKESEKMHAKQVQEKIKKAENPEKVYFCGLARSLEGSQKVVDFSEKKDSEKSESLIGFYGKSRNLTGGVSEPSERSETPAKSPQSLPFSGKPRKL